MSRFVGEMDWSKDGESLQRLRQLVAEGLSASQIGRLMGVSRRSIIGACHRRGIVLRRSPFWVADLDNARKPVTVTLAEIWT